MRQIKFKAYHPNSKTWFKDFTLSNDGTEIYETGDRYNVESGEVILCQYVRTDMYRGVETSFYNGDIVMVEIPYNDELIKGEIYYDKTACAFRIKLHKNGGVYIDWLTVLTVRQVIGNIHTNPELIQS